MATPRPRPAAPPGSALDLGSGWLLYLYGILEAGTDAHRLLGAGAISGLEPTQAVLAVEGAGLVAAVSRVPAETFEEAPLNELAQDLTRLAPMAVRHEEVVERLARHAPALVPMTFGAVYRSVEGVLGLLHERSAELVRLLDLVRGCQEWGIKVFADQERLTTALVAESEAVRAMDAEIAASAPGRAYLLRKQRSRVMAEELDRLLDEQLTALLGSLEMLSRAVRTERLEAVVGSPLVLKASFLVPMERAHGFQEVGAQLASAYESRGLPLELSGPWAPYAFVRMADGAA
jgi:hypothetical protein